MHSKVSREILMFGRTNGREAMPPHRVPMVSVCTRLLRATPSGRGRLCCRAVSNQPDYAAQELTCLDCEALGYYEGELSTECFNTHNETALPYRDMTVENAVNRQWNWMLCNEP